MKKILICLIFIFSVFLIHSTVGYETEPKGSKEEKKFQKSTEVGENIFEHKSYEKIITLFKEWEAKSENFIEVKTYGKTSGNLDQYYIRISNETSPGEKVVLLTASTHGNEPLSTSVMIAYIGSMLNFYGKNKEITEILNSTTIYFVPVVSPDSYPDKRNVDNVDPNRNFPTLKNPQKESVVPIKNLQKLFLEIKPNSVLSGHTYGRLFLIPWGDSVIDNPNYLEYKSIVDRMSEISKYGNKKASQLYGKPIFGTEIDWYHRNGAFAIVVEFGTHQRKPSLADTKEEFNRTFDSFIYFLEESTKVLIYN